MPDHDLLLLETVKTHRARLRGAFLFGGLARRRQVNSNVKRLIASLVLAAVACAGCAGASFIQSFLAKQNATQPGIQQSTTTTQPQTTPRPHPGASDPAEAARP